MTNFNFTSLEREELLHVVLKKLEKYYHDTNSLDVSPIINIEEIASSVTKIDFDNPETPRKALLNAIENLQKYSVHPAHPKYFGLFNPRVNFASILSDLITAVFNPQLAAWSHAPFAAEVENFIIKELGKKFGYQPDKIDGVFTTGGAEANLTALLCALNHTFSDFAENGLFGMSKKPILYCSAEAHHSIQKAAKTVGLGYSSVKSIKTDDNLKISVDDLYQEIQKDIKEGYQPLMIIGTAGTTGSGAIDDLVAINKIAKEFDIWFHVDAAYGGAAILNKDLKQHLNGIELSDSITFDAHKWMSVGMGTSIFFTSHRHILSKTFRITTKYMPKDIENLKTEDPYSHSIQWSRRAIGLKLYLSLSIFGWKGYDELIGHQKMIGDYFKQKLIENNWSIKNKSPLPIYCFTDDRFSTNQDFVQTIEQRIIDSGKSWLSVYSFNKIYTLRACITNYSTTKMDIDELILELNKERKDFIERNFIV